MKAATKTTFLKQSNISIINKGLEGSKLFAYMRLLKAKGTEIEQGKYKGGRMLYIGGQNYIGGKFTTYPNGSIKATLINGVIDA